MLISLRNSTIVSIISRLIPAGIGKGLREEMHLPDRLYDLGLVIIEVIIINLNLNLARGYKGTDSSRTIVVESSNLIIANSLFLLNLLSLPLSNLFLVSIVLILTLTSSLYNIVIETSRLSKTSA